MKRLEGKTAIVTGASKGIGAAIAKELAAEGARMVVNYASSRERAEDVVAAITEVGGQAIAVQANVANGEDVKRLFAETLSAFSRLDILVNNAAVYGPTPLDAITIEEFRSHFDTNVLGVIQTIQEAARHFGPSGGSIVNIGSIDSIRAVPGMAVYSATKGALDCLTRAFAAELGSRGIRVNTLAPGGTHTEGIESVGFIGSPFEKDMIEKTPLGRLGQPQDIAKAAAFLASDDAAWITGDRLVASGGFYG
ncbi:MULTISPECIES: glucose 1-dehydrogenase [unclassified Rhizobium]|uniref:SDR family NAD(P)-dependent oxidoreductase n=1 Tax=unclassified Rhizobium TaxID=2613769 RepID=UPI001ADD01CC|nr:MULTISPECIES: glucose 1-dehydrogenase [unclassified Rhizobium]MBO9128053.1 glucose 1-dehydrogenase [Rhizobium sp. 16-488-2b]MBO9178587.1 glucose 1-dehydrogenase [Rhizobium sp. 16-488-2a]